MENEIRAILQKAAAERGLDVIGGWVRRTSSRFCLGVEHGDYNGMELFGVGTDRFIWLAFKPNLTRRIRIFSTNFPNDSLVDFPLGKDCPAEKVKDSWERFPRGAEAVLRREGYVLSTGLDAVLYGNIPGGGMSRSASLALNLILTMLQVNGIGDPGGMVAIDLAQMVENDYIGSPCGKLDQIMIYHAREGMGTYYRPGERTVEHIPFGGDVDSFRIVSLDTGTTRPGLEKSTYRIRRNECDAMLAALSAEFAIGSLAEISDKTFYQEAAAHLKDIGLGKSVPRLKYLFEAGARFSGILDAWRGGNISKLGANFRADGIGLRDDYRISGPELETMCDIARTVDGVLGERMLGGGDKGASGAIVRTDAFEALRDAVDRAYPLSHPELAADFDIHSCRTVDGIVCNYF